ncbi:MAG: APC family permease, partial [Gemmatimonadales bacterium]
VPVLFAYGGWQTASFVSAELRQPERDLPRGMLLGVTGVVVLYLGVSWVCVRVLGPEALAATSAPASDVMRRAVGERGAAFIAAGIAVSTFGFLNLVILVSPRVYQAMAADGVFFPRFARLHPTYRTPSAGIVFQGAWAIALALSGTYGQLLDYVVFGDWIFFGLTVATLFVDRRRESATRPPSPARERGSGGEAFRVPGFPWVPALFILSAIYVLVSSVAANPGNAASGGGLILLGVPVFLYWRRRGRTGERGMGNGEK